MALVAGMAPARADLLPVPMSKVIVQQWDGSDPAPQASLALLGGTVTAQLPVVGGFAATVPTASIGTIASLPGVRVVSPDSLVLPQGDLTAAPIKPSAWRPAIGADVANAAGQTGQGVTVALIDTGVANVPDLAGRLVPVTQPGTTQTDVCLNLSDEAGCADSYGHGTFVAGLIAGSGAASGGQDAGAAPAARILAVKLSGRDGQSSVAKVLGAIQWVLANKDTYGIRVLNLSLRVDSNLSYRLDPVNLAVERAWAAGLVVVVSAGNLGSAASTIAKPADDPWVISVGSTDDNGTTPMGDDAVSDFSSRGPTPTDGLAKPDLVVPGRHLVSLRSPGSQADLLYPNFADATYRYGSGTSFSAGIVSGTAAVLLAADPTATNDRVKYELTSAGRPVPGAGVMDAGAGMPSVPAALAAGPGTANQQLFQPLLFPSGTPSATDLLGSVYQGSNWQGSNWQGSNWQGSNWQGSNWQGSNWQGSNWQGSNWQGSNWQGSNWQGRYWS